MKTWKHPLWICAALALVSQPAAALQFWPSASEWASWPEYCQAKYSRTNPARGTEYDHAVPNAVVEKWQNSLGRVWVFVHHHCAGLIYLQRARLAPDPRAKKEALRHALGESRFTIDRIPSSHPIYAEIATHMGQVERERGDMEGALRYYDLAITSHPENPSGYQGKALMLRSQGDLDGALEVLEQADKLTGGSSAEVHYFLGLVLVDKKDYEKARLHAEKAYQLGYPLPGLRNKLAVAGFPLSS